MNKKLKILEDWFSLIRRIKEQKELINPFELTDMLMNWAYNIKQKYPSEGMNKLYEIYISHYVSLNQSDYAFDALWYDIEELVDYDLIKPSPQSINRVFEIINFVLNEVFTFKTTIECPHCDNEYRAHMDQDFNLYLYCEQCNYYKDHDESDLAGKKLSPASLDVIKKYQLSHYTP